MSGERFENQRPLSMLTIFGKDQRISGRRVLINQKITPLRLCSLVRIGREIKMISHRDHRDNRGFCWASPPLNLFVFLSQNSMIRDSTFDVGSSMFDVQLFPLFRSSELPRFVFPRPLESLNPEPLLVPGSRQHPCIRLVGF